MRRREFITLLGGAAITWPLTARAQRPAGASNRLALLSPPEPNALMNEHGPNRYWRALLGHLRQLGYVEGQNLVIERFGKGATRSCNRALWERPKYCCLGSGRCPQ